MVDIIDTHCHLDFAIFNEDRDQVINNAKRNGVCKLIIPGVRGATWLALQSLVSSHQCLHYALGLHPYFIGEHRLQDLVLLKDLLINRRGAVAIGEIGLDFFDKSLDRAKQISMFSQQLDLAAEFQLPVILHVRKAHDDVLKLLGSHKYGGIVHGFSGGIDIAKRYLNLGFKLGFGGMTSYPHSRKLHDLVRKLPLDGIVLETDAPDMSGYKYRGQRNSPEFLPVYLDAIADLRPENLQKIAEQTCRNTIDVLALETFLTN